MRKIIKNLFALAALVGTEAWFLKGYFADQPDYEPALAFIAALGFVLQGIDWPDFRKKTASVHDKELFRAFMADLQPNQIMSFFKEHDFGASFLRSDVAPLYSFVQTWGGVDREFFDQELDKERKVIYSLASELAHEISARTVPIRDGNLISVFSDQQRASGHPRPKSVIEDAMVLNEKSSIFSCRYEEFVRLCKSKLEKDF